MPKIAVTNQELEMCFDVMTELRPHLTKSLYLSRVREAQKQGYQLAFLKDAGSVVAVAGYRIGTNLFMGKNLYVDDLVTCAKARSEGYGEALINWLRDTAQKSGCEVLHLDSGTQRDQAHKFYFKQGLSIASYHFSQKLE